MRLAWLLCSLLAATIAVATTPEARAQVGARPILRILVPLPAGSTSDAVARLVGQRLAGATGQAVVVENRPGASGRIAADEFVRAAPDGRTLLLAPVAVPVLGPLVFRNLKYDPAKDFAPVAQVSRFAFAFAVPADHPARTMPEFVAWARLHPDRAAFGSPGAGSLPHFVGAMVGREAGIDLQHVAYRGAAPLEVEMMNGNVAAGVSALSDFVALHHSGRLRILAVTGEKRSPLLPLVPTLREQGYGTVDVVGWHGLYVPAGTPPPVIDRLSRAIVDALQRSDVREKLLALGLEPTGTTPERLAAIMADDTARWREIVRATGFTAE